MPAALWSNVSAILATAFVLHYCTTSTLNSPQNRDDADPEPHWHSKTAPPSPSDTISLQVRVHSSEDGGVPQVGVGTQSASSASPRGIPVYGPEGTGLSLSVKRTALEDSHRNTSLGADGRHAEETSVGEALQHSQPLRKKDTSCCKVMGKESHLESDIFDKISEYHAIFNGTLLAKSVLSTIIIVFLILLSIPILDVFIHPEFYLGAEHTLGHGGPGGYGGFYDGYGIFDYSGVGYGGSGGGVGGYDTLYGGHAKHHKIKRAVQLEESVLKQIQRAPTVFETSDQDEKEDTA